MDKKYNVGYKGRDKEITMRMTDIYTYCIMGEEGKNKSVLFESDELKKDGKFKCFDYVYLYSNPF